MVRDNRCFNGGGLAFDYEPERRREATNVFESAPEILETLTGTSIGKHASRAATPLAVSLQGLLYILDWFSLVGNWQPVHRRRDGVADL